MQALSGGVGINFASASGYLTSKLFAITVPIIFIIYGVLLGAAAVGREEDRGTAELLLTAPITRRRVVAEKALAAAALLAPSGSRCSRRCCSATPVRHAHLRGNLLAASLASILIGTTFGALALAISGALGHRAHPAAGRARSRSPPTSSTRWRRSFPASRLAEGLALLLVPGLRSGRERLRVGHLAVLGAAACC